MADVYRRRRIVAVALGLVMVVGLLAASRTLALALAPPPPGAAPAVAVEAGVPTATVVVARGDTLWSIARRMRPQGDVRAVVDRLAAAHGPGALQPGERLVIEAGGVGGGR